jgi:uncharacterized protein (DUF58 family)
MARVTVLPEAGRSPGRQSTEEAQTLAARLPRLVLEARQGAAAVHGLHGRRRAGPGESFWQFRPFTPGEAAQRVDWRRSARDDRLYVRQREWEAAQTFWLWIDRSASMGYMSSLARASKVERAMVVGFALAEVLIEAGERVGYLGLLPPRASRHIAEKIGEALISDKKGLDVDMAPADTLLPQSEGVLIGDFLVPPAALEACVDALAGRGARGHLVMVVDPVEETFPFAGQAELADLEVGLRLRVGDAAAWASDFRLRMAAHREAVGAIAARRGWTLTLHRTDRPASEAVLRLITLIAANRGSHRTALKAAGGQ